MIPTNEILQGHVLDVLKTLPDGCVQTCITSPPYWGLRDYGVDGQIGLEKTPEEYVEKMVLIFREVRRVLRDDGTLWLNLGDSYAASGRGGGGGSFQNDDIGRKISINNSRRKPVIGLKSKDLVGIPWRVAFALQQPYYVGSIKEEKDRVWLASMIDGEGCMFLHKRKAGQSNGQGYFRQNDSYGAGLEVANTHESIVKRCLEITGVGSICYQDKESRHKNRNQRLFRWNLRSNQCRDIIKEVYPYLVGKKHEARLVLGCPSSGEDAEKAHASLMNLHSGFDACIDFPEPKSMYEKGFYLRQDIVWSKNNPMPESVTDRCTKSHEYIFLMSKSAKYYYDHEAIKEPATETNDARQRMGQGPNTQYAQKRAGVNSRIYQDRDPHHPTERKIRKEFNPSQAGGGTNVINHSGNSKTVNGKRNKRDVWNVATYPVKEAHFATFPPKLIEPCILAGCPENGIVLDPFMGAGTTALVSILNNRRFLGIELKPAYIALTWKRLEKELEKHLKLSERKSRV